MLSLKYGLINGPETIHCIKNIFINPSGSVLQFLPTALVKYFMLFVSVTVLPHLGLCYSGKTLF